MTCLHVFCSGISAISLLEKYERHMRQSQDHQIQAILAQPDHSSPARGAPVHECAQPRAAKSDSADS